MLCIDPLEIRPRDLTPHNTALLRLQAKTTTKAKAEFRLRRCDGIYNISHSHRNPSQGRESSECHPVQVTDLM